MIRIDVDHEIRTRFVIVDGSSATRSFSGSSARRSRVPNFDPTYDDVVDLTTVERVDVTREGLRSLVDLVVPRQSRDPEPSRDRGAEGRHLRRRADVRQMRGDVARRIKVFRTRNDASRGLAQPAELKAAPGLPRRGS